MVKMKLGELIDINEQCNDALKFVSKLGYVVEKDYTKSVEFFDGMNMSDIRHKLVDLKDVVTQMKMIAVDLIDRVEVSI
jgi:hypothetical protein